MEEFEKYRSRLAEEYGVKELIDDKEDSYTEPNNNMTSNKITIPKSLPNEVESTLNQRLGDEYTAYYFYRNAANQCKNINYKKAASFFNSEAEGELGHAQGIQDYLTQWNLIPEIPQVPTYHKFVSLVDIINKAYEIEYNLLEKYIRLRIYKQ